MLQANYELDREQYTDAILQSVAHKKIIVAGPGTGKTFLFGEICKKINGQKLILSFINELVNDLRQSLSDLAEVRTLHSFARGMLKADFFVKLTEVIEMDFKLIFGKNISFKEIFSKLLDGYVDELKFYSDRRKYYAYVGPFCSIYELIKLFESGIKPIPSYAQLLVDEFQDFNRLEARLIDLLAQNSPVLLVGDDDQSLYSFKYAEPDEIRTRHNSGSYESFQLPYCSRCPEVLVNAVNSLVEKAKKFGFLKGRLDKVFRYFHSEEKDKISTENPKLFLQRPVFEKATAFHIEAHVRNIAEIDKDISVLVICSLSRQIVPLANDLKRKGFKNIQTPMDRSTLSKEDGYRLLLKDQNSNLGWRILANFYLVKKDLEEAVKKSIDKEEPFFEHLNQQIKKRVVCILRILKKIKDNKQITEKEAETIFDEFKYNPTEITVEKIKREIISSTVPDGSYKSIPIKIVTMLGAKGLTSDYVFLANFDDRFILDRGMITDENVCKFLVALTRAKKRLTIFSAQKDTPTFINWLQKDLCEEI